MVAGCGGRCLKYSLVIFNTIFLVTGLGLIALGAYMLIMVDTVTALLQPPQNSEVELKIYAKVGAIIFLASGAILTIISIFGCCGACRELKWMLGTFAILLGVVVIAKVVFIVQIFKMKNEVGAEARRATEMFHIGIRAYKGELTTSNNVNHVQQMWKCCGDDHWMNFRKESRNWPDRYKQSVPLSCCVFTKQQVGVLNINDLVDPTCLTKPNTSNSYIGTTCREQFKCNGLLCTLFITMISLSFGLIAVELAAAVFATCLISLIGVPY